MQSFSEYYNYKIQTKTEERVNVSNNTTTHLSSVKNDKCVVVLPIYKTNFTPFEYFNTKNNIDKLKNSYDICLLCPEKLNVSSLKTIFECDFLTSVFPNKYFISKESYSFLLEQPDFYKRFFAWEYMLIIQEDVFIFKDSSVLDEFIGYGYMYIGGPWTSEYCMRSAMKINSEMTGNGGLSLRNTKGLADMLSKSKYKNLNLKTVEDQYISYMLYKEKMFCPVDISKRFSIDNDYKLWHNKLDGDYPFGVHMGCVGASEYWQDTIVNESEKIIISLTSFGERLIFDVPRVIDNIINNMSSWFYKIVLCIYKDDIKYIPASIKKYIDNGIVEIIVAEQNLRPHLKYYYTMLKYPYNIIITLDDDQNYDKDTLEFLYKCHIEHPDCVIANRTHLITYNNNGTAKEKYSQWKYEYKNLLNPSFDLLATGVGGVLYPPDILKVKNIDLNEMREYITTDDLYLKLIENRLDVKVCYSGSKNRLKPFISRSSKKDRLCDMNTMGICQNDINIKKMHLIKKGDVFKKICYTVISGPYDTLKEPIVVTPEWRYICFTDQKFVSNVWEIRPIPDEIMNDKSLNQVKKQRIMKIQPYKFINYDVCIWVDANLVIRTNFDNLIETFSGNNIVTIKHPDRDCIYQEALAIERAKKDRRDILQNQLQIYKKEGFPEHYGLSETNVIIRYNKPDVKEIMDDWASMLRMYSHRDQMSFNYVLWKHNYKIGSIEPKIRDRYFKHCSHSGKK